MCGSQNRANFASHAFLTLAPPSGYALNLKALTKVSKVSWTSQLSYEILRSSLERQFDKIISFLWKVHLKKARVGLLWLKNIGLVTSFVQLKLFFSVICCLIFWLINQLDQPKWQATMLAGQRFKQMHQTFVS